MGLWAWINEKFTGKKIENQPQTIKQQPISNHSGSSLYNSSQDPIEIAIRELEIRKKDTVIPPEKEKQSPSRTQATAANLNLMPAANNEENNNTPIKEPYKIEIVKVNQENQIEKIDATPGSTPKTPPPSKVIVTVQPSAVHTAPVPARNKSTANAPLKRTHKEPYNDPFSWVYGSVEYANAVTEISKEKQAAKACYFCNGDCTQSYISLTNGNRIHADCYDKATKAITSVKNTTEAQAYFLKNPHTPLGIKLTNTYWPTYPPDWETLRSATLKRANYSCEDCSTTQKELHAHHMLALSDGGSNHLGNLKCVCHDCHQKYHPLFTIKYTPDKKMHMVDNDSAYQKNIKTIQKCLDEKQDFSFHYVDSQKKEKDRTVTPHRVTLNPPNSKKYRYTGALYLLAYCHLSKGNRTFRISRISKLTVP